MTSEGRKRARGRERTDRGGKRKNAKTEDALPHVNRGTTKRGSRTEWILRPVCGIASDLY